MNKHTREWMNRKNLVTARRRYVKPHVYRALIQTGWVEDDHTEWGWLAVAPLTLNPPTFTPGSPYYALAPSGRLDSRCRSGAARWVAKAPFYCRDPEHCNGSCQREIACNH